MSISSITTSLISKLGNNSGSIVPVIAKDTGSSVGITLIHSKNGSERDGKEKAIEEFGTEAIWLGGIPLLKKAFDLSVYKIANIDPNFDIRKLNLKNPDNITVMMKNAQEGSKHHQALKRISENQTLTKGLFVGKFITATAATLLALGALINFKQKTTEKDVMKKILEEKKAQDNIVGEKISQHLNDSKAFQSFRGQPSFKGAGSALGEFMFNPVKNMSLLDLGIFSIRTSKGRKGEKSEIAIKELLNFAFIYLLAKPIQNGLEKIGAKVFNRPINLDYRMLSDSNFKEAFGNDTFKETMKKFKNLDNDGIIKHIFDKGDDKLVQLLKRTGEIPVLKKTGEINAMKFIEPDKLKGVVSNLENIIETQAKSGIGVEEFIKQTRKLKTASIFGNIAIAILFLGVLQPVIAIIRRKNKGDGEGDNLAFKKVEADLKNRMA